MEEKKYNKFIQHPSNSNLLINLGLIIGFIILVISQFILFRTMAQQRIRTVSNIGDGADQAANSNLLVASSDLFYEAFTNEDLQLVSCSDDDLSNAVAAVKPAIVNIDVVSSDVGFGSSRSRMGFDFDIPSARALRSNEESLGSGVIVDSRGYILTCYHLIENFPRVYVTIFTSQNRTFEAELIDVDIAKDLALLRIYPDSAIPVAKLGNSDLAKATDTVLTIGSPFGFQHTVTAGIISDNKRSLVIEGRLYQDLFQTDASINRGSAGGALINTEGEIIGINTAITSGSEYFSGISFAIPINEARALLFKGIES